MSIDASAVARVLGIESKFTDLRGGNVLYLPQRIAVIALGEEDVTYDTAKFQATSAAEVGAKLGYSSQAYQVAEQLWPKNGDGVGSIPVTFYPLANPPSGSTQAIGGITPSGTATAAASLRVRIAGKYARAFTVPKGAVDVTAICAEIGKSIVATLGLPVFTEYTHGTITGTPGGSNTGDGTLTGLSADATTAPGDYTLTCNTAAVDGGTFTLVDPDGSIVSTTVDVSGSPQSVGGLNFTLTDGTADFVVGDTFTISAPATDVALTVPWLGSSGNDVKVEIIGDTQGAVFAITQPTGGTNNPDITPATDQLGDVWETMVINAMEYDDTTTLDALQTVGDGRWLETVRKPFVAFHGCTVADRATAVFPTSTRTDDRVNVQLVAPGSPNLPCAVAARQVARIAKVANNNPPTDYGAQRATGLVPGLDSEQWDWASRDVAVKAGSSTVEIKAETVTISDVVTAYAPVGEDPPAYRYVVDIVKLSQILFNMDLIFAAEEWAAAPLIPDSQPTTNENAKRPKDAKAEVNAMLDSLGLEAIISDPATAKKSTTASIDSQNPKRLNVSTTVQLSGNTNIKSATLNWGFYFGGAAA